MNIPKFLLSLVFFFSLFSFVTAAGTGGTITYDGAYTVHTFVNDGLIAHYKLNDNLSTTNVIDTIGGYNGTASANTDTLDTTGKINGALNFDGDGDYISGDYASLNLTNTDFAISSWVKMTAYPKSFSGYYRYSLFSNIGSLVTREGIMLTIGGTDGTDLNRMHLEMNGASVDVPTTMTVGTWYLVSVVKNGSNIYFYNNGVQQGDVQAASTIGANTAYRIGASTYGGGYEYYLNGSIDDVRIYNKSLSQAEITALYNSGSGTETDNIFTPPAGVTNVSVLVVAGGGGGGGRAGRGGGGGAGGYQYNSSFPVTNQEYVVTVGVGGVGGTVANGYIGGNGSNSVFSTISAIGGGGGGSGNGLGSLSLNNNGRDGGSGGGAASYYGSGTKGSANLAGQGNDGGIALEAPDGYGGGAGGGSSTAGSNG